MALLFLLMRISTANSQLLYNFFACLSITRYNLVTCYSSSIKFSFLTHWAISKLPQSLGYISDKFIRNAVVLLGESLTYFFRNCHICSNISWRDPTLCWLDLGKLKIQFGLKTSCSTCLAHHKHFKPVPQPSLAFYRDPRSWWSSRRRWVWRWTLRSWRRRRRRRRRFQRRQKHRLGFVVLREERLHRRRFFGAKKRRKFDEASRETTHRFFRPQTRVVGQVSDVGEQRRRRKRRKDFCLRPAVEVQPRALVCRLRQGASSGCSSRWPCLTCWIFFNWTCCGLLRLLYIKRCSWL